MEVHLKCCIVVMYIERLRTDRDTAYLPQMSWNFDNYLDCSDLSSDSNTIYLISITY